MDRHLTTLETRLDTILPTLATKTDIAEVRSDIKGWTIGTAVAVVTATLVVITFMINRAIPSGSALPSAAPVVILIPARPT
jgi:hypothetical protein